MSSSASAPVCARVCMWEAAPATHASVNTQMPVCGLAQTQASTITWGLEKMLYRERLEELKLLFTTDIEKCLYSV